MSMEAAMIHDFTGVFFALGVILKLAGLAIGAYTLHLYDSYRDLRKSEADRAALSGRTHLARFSMFAAIAGGQVCNLIVSNDRSNRLLTGAIVLMMLGVLWLSAMVREKRRLGEPAMKADPGNMLHANR